jgi:hypothetical protein
VRLFLPPTDERKLMAKTDETGAVVEYEAGDGEFYCEGCGTRYDTPGTCEGPVGGNPHEPIAVVKVDGGNGGASSESLKSKTKAELEVIAAERGVDVVGDETKAELVAAIEDAAA